MSDSAVFKHAAHMDGLRQAIPPKGHWRRFGKSAILTCHKCNFSASLYGTHEINDKGEVTPSLMCMVCDYHEHISLEGWDPKPLRPGEDSTTY
jgi:hypothetical protein